MEINHEKTERGFVFIGFEDSYGVSSSLQESSICEPPSIWVGVNEIEPKIMACDTPEGGNGWVEYPVPKNVLMSSRMHLTQEQVEKLIPYLQRFVETGRLPSPEEEDWMSF